MGIAVDGSTPAVVTLTNGTHTAISTASFSPPASSLILISYNQEYSGSGNTQPTLTPSTTGTLSWTTGPSQWQASLNGYTAMWAAYTSSAQSGITVTVTPSLSYTGGAQLRVYVLTGTAADSFAGGSAQWSAASSTVENASITTRRTGSVVMAAGLGIGTGVWTPTGNIATDGAVFVDATSNNSAIVGHSIATPVVIPGTSAMGWTISPACLTNGTLWEIMPPAQAALQQQPGGELWRRRHRRVQWPVPPVSPNAIVTPGVLSATVSIPAPAKVYGHTFWSIAGMTVEPYGGYTAGGKLVLPCLGSTYTTAISGNFLNMQGSSLDIRIDSIMDTVGNGTTEFIMWTRFDANNGFLMFAGDGGAIQARLRQASVNTTFNIGTFNPVTHRYWRISESGGTAFFYTSADHTTWTQQWSVAHSLGTKLNAMRLRLECGYYGTETNPGNTVIGAVNQS